MSQMTKQDFINNTLIIILCIVLICKILRRETWHLKMYHKFLKTSDQEQLNTILHSMIRYYEKTQPFQSLLGLGFTNRITINFSVYNQKHKTKLFLLSNGKVLRYDFDQKRIYQLQGFEEIHVQDIKPLDISRKQKYLVMTQDSLLICGFKQRQINEKVINNGESVKIEQERQHKQDMQVQCDQLPINIGSIICQLSGSVFIQKWVKWNYNAEQEQQPMVSHLKERSMHFVKGLFQDIENGYRIEEMFILVISQPTAILNHCLMVYRIEYRSKAEGNLKAQKQIQALQQFTIEPVLLGNDRYCIEMALSDIDVAGSINQHRQLDPNEIKQNNLKHKITHPLIKVDPVISTHNTISFYLATQCITQEFEQTQYQNKIFWFQLKIKRQTNIQMKQFTVINEENPKKLPKQKLKIEGILFEYPQKIVLCPNHVFHFPIVHESSVLRYFSVSKSLIGQKQDLESPKYLMEQERRQNQNTFTPLKVSITLIITQPNNKMLVMSVDTNLIKQNFTQFDFYINQQNLLLYTVVSQKFTLRDVLLLDSLKKYAILLVNQNSVKIANLHQRNLNDLMQDENQKENIVMKEINNEKLLTQNNNNTQHSLKLIILNIAPNFTGKTRIVQQHLLDESFNDDLSAIMVEIPQRQRIHLSDSLGLLPNQLNSPKAIMATNAKVKGKQTSMALILIPKTQLYQSMLMKVLKDHQSGQKQLEDSLNISHEAFLTNILMNLAI